MYMKKFVAVAAHVMASAMVVVVSALVSKNVEVTYFLVAIIFQMIFLFLLGIPGWSEGVYLSKLLYSGLLIFVLAILISVTAILMNVSLAGYVVLLVFLSVLAFLLM